MLQESLHLRDLFCDQLGIVPPGRHGSSAPLENISGLVCHLPKQGSLEYLVVNSNEAFPYPPASP